MKTVLHRIYGKPCVISAATPPRPGRWVCVACAVCGIAVEADAGTVFGKTVQPVHSNCYDSAADLDAENSYREMMT